MTHISFDRPGAATERYARHLSEAVEELQQIIALLRKHAKLDEIAESLVEQAVARNTPTALRKRAGLVSS